MEADVRRAVEDYFGMTAKRRMEYGVPQEAAEVQVVPLAYLRRRCRPLASFRNDRRGANAALASVLKAMVDGGDLRAVPLAQAAQQFKTTVPLYVTGETWAQWERKQ